MNTCKHVQKIRLSSNHSVLNSQKWKCVVCNSMEDIWACLSCAHAGCGKYLEEHIKLHYNATKHPISMNVSQKYVYCYECDNYILNDNAAGDVKILRNCLQAISSQQHQQQQHEHHQSTFNTEQQHLNHSSSTTSLNEVCRRRSSRVQKSSNNIIASLLQIAPKNVGVDNTEDVAYTELWFRRYYLLAHFFNKWKLKSTNLQCGASIESDDTEDDNASTPQKKNKRSRSRISSTSPPRSSKRRRHVIPGAVGLQNLGNTCYMNSILQVLRHLSQFSKVFIEENANRSNNTSSSNVQNSNSGISTSSFLTANNSNITQKSLCDDIKSGIMISSSTNNVEYQQGAMTTNSALNNISSIPTPSIINSANESSHHDLFEIQDGLSSSSSTISPTPSTTSSSLVTVSYIQNNSSLSEPNTSSTNDSCQLNSIVNPLTTTSSPTKVEIPSAKFQLTCHLNPNKQDGKLVVMNMEEDICIESTSMNTNNNKLDYLHIQHGVQSDCCDNRVNKKKNNRSVIMNGSADDLCGCDVKTGSCIHHCISGDMGCNVFAKESNSDNNNNINNNNNNNNNITTNNSNNSNNDNNINTNNSIAKRLKASRKRTPTKLSLSHELNSLLRIMWSGKMTMVSPHKMLYAVWNIIPFFRGYSQQDAQEFLSEFLDKVQSEMDVKNLKNSNMGGSKHLNRNGNITINDNNNNKNINDINTTATVRHKPNCMLRSHRNENVTNGRGIQECAPSTTHNQFEVDGLAMVNPVKMNEDIVTQLFQGELISQVRCLTCGYESNRKEAFMDLSLEFPIRFHTRTGSNRINSLCKLEEMLRQFMQVEKLDGKIYACEQCNSNKDKEKIMRHGDEACETIYSEAEKRFLINKLPNVLRLHLKRFMWSGRSSKGKISVNVAFPHHLDVTEFCHPDVATDSFQYSLSAVVMHHGRGFGSGHYTAYCWNNDADSWLHCNDAKMHKATLEDVHKAQAYILVYTKLLSASATTTVTTSKTTSSKQNNNIIASPSSPNESCSSTLTKNRKVMTRRSMIPKFADASRRLRVENQGFFSIKRTQTTIW